MTLRVLEKFVSKVCVDKFALTFWALESSGLHAGEKVVMRLGNGPRTETQQRPQNGQIVRGFQVRTPICHIVLVSHAYPFLHDEGEGPKMVE